METTVIRHVDAMRAPTWHRLRMNHADVSVDVAGACAPAHVEAHGFSPADDSAFDDAVRALQERLAAPEAACDSDPAASHGLLDVAALSRYQQNRAATEARKDVAAAFETGSGRDAQAFVEKHAEQRIVLYAPEHARGAHAVVRLRARDASLCACALDIVLGADAEAQVLLVFEGEGETGGLLASSVRVFGGAESTLRLSSVQAASAAWTILDGAGCILDEGARLDTAHYALSSGKSYTGLACDLRGARAETQASLRYLGRESAELDFNYEFDHRGRDTHSDLAANGVLAGESVKTLRGTIDFIRGCKGSSGHEQETALIADERAHNLSCPVILCGEDDVAGDHGAAIGHIGTEQMFYLASRGLSADAAEALFAQSVFESALADPACDAAREAIERRGAAVLGVRDAKELS